jgi:ribosomal protein L11
MVCTCLSLFGVSGRLPVAHSLRMAGVKASSIFKKFRAKSADKKSTPLEIKGVQAISRAMFPN